MTIYRHTSSLSARLTRMNLLISLVVLLLAAIAFFTYDLVSFREHLIANLQAQAEIVGDGAETALLFNDPQSASVLLATLQNAPDVIGATIRSEDGNLFAMYGPITPQQKMVYQLAPGETNRWWKTSSTHILFAHRVMSDGRSLGVVYIIASTAEIHRRARQYLLIALGILVLCTAAGVLIGEASQRWISQPIRKLAETASQISREQDYSVRARVSSDATEIATLVHAFNGMLGQIEQRDAALTEARDELETRVAERTAELQVANRELEAFSYTVAHDLRGPLDAINGIAYLLSNTPVIAQDASSSTMLEHLKESTDNMTNLIDDLLRFARAATLPVRCEPVDISAIARDIASDLQRSEPSRTVHFAIQELPEVEADRGLLRIVLDNLLRNAWKYTSHHATASIEFGSRTEGGSAMYFVRDDGAGFDPSHMTRLFQPFQRLHGKGEFPGTGIGLATVQRILERLGGNIWAEAQVEEGAAFYFTLGRSSAPPAE